VFLFWIGLPISLKKLLQALIPEEADALLGDLGLASPLGSVRGDDKFPARRGNPQ
jgi:hypothetical protein